MTTIGKTAAHSAYDMFSWYMYLIVNLVIFPPRFLECESFFLIAPFPDLCLLVPLFNLITLFMNSGCFHQGH